MFSNIKRMLKDKYRFVLILTASVAGFQEMYIALFPEIQKQAEQLNQLLEAYPESFMKAFGIDSATSMFNTIENYLSTEMFTFFWPILMIVAAASFAGYAIAGDIDKGTIEMALSQPISRLKLFFSRYLGGAIGLTFFSIVSSFAPVVFAEIHGIAYDIKKFAVVSVGCILLSFAVFSLAMLFSSFVSDKGKVGMLTGGTLALMYVINIVAGLNDKFENLKYFSFFNYFRGETFLGKGEFVEWSVPFFLAVTLVFTAIAAYKFNKRDLAT